MEDTKLIPKGKIIETLFSAVQTRNYFPLFGFSNFTELFHWEQGLLKTGQKKNKILLMVLGT